MKVMSKAKANLSKLAHWCHKEPIVVTVNGEPSFEMVPVDKDEDLINQLIEHNPRFRKLLADALKAKTMSVEEARRRL